MALKSGHMDLWSLVEKTDPAHTKEVKQRGGFTSIDAMYQIKRMTECFGPVGKGWGYACTHSIEKVGEKVVVAVCDVDIWWSLSDGGAHHVFGPIRGTNSLIDDKGRYDEDAPKKAMTDALTKGISHLGFSADIYMGMWDDSKYVEQRKRDVAAEKVESDGKLNPAVSDLLAKITACTTAEEIGDVYTKAKPYLSTTSQPVQDLVILRCKAWKNTLQERARQRDLQFQTLYQHEQKETEGQ